MVPRHARGTTIGKGLTLKKALLRTIDDKLKESVLHGLLDERADIPTRNVERWFNSETGRRILYSADPNGKDFGRIRLLPDGGSAGMEPSLSGLVYAISDHGYVFKKS
jgi:hypothetical protein